MHNHNFSWHQLTTIPCSIMSITSFQSVLNGSVHLDRWWRILSNKQGECSSRRFSGESGVPVGEEKVELKTLFCCLFLFSVLPLSHDSPSNCSIPLDKQFWVMNLLHMLKQVNYQIRPDVDFLNMKQILRAKEMGHDMCHIDLGCVVSSSHLHIRL